MRAFAVVLLFVPVPALATSIVLPDWHQQVFDAGFVGIVECGVAGETVAKYRVIESWKGSKPGAGISIAGRLDTFSPHLPVALCGDRFLVTARRLGDAWASSEGLSYRIGAGEPVWWRNLPAEFQVSWGMVRLSSGPLDDQKISVPGIATAASREFDASEGTTIAQYRDSVKSFLSLSPEAQEREVLRVRTSALLWKRRWSLPDSGVRVFKSMLPTLTLRQIVNEWLNFARADPKEGGTVAQIAMAASGGPITLGILDSTDRRAVFHRNPDMAVRDIRYRLGLPPYGQPAYAVIPPRPPDSTLDRMRQVLRLSRQIPYPGSDSIGSVRAFPEAFVVLTTHDPAAVVEFLVRWERRSGPRSYTDDGYVYGSYFGWRCGPERSKHLSALLAARDPYVRVAAAVYLAMELDTGDEKSGLQKLREFTKLPGEPGVWAALALARRGDKKSMSRALEVMSHPAGSTVWEGSITDLQARIAVLLSNSAKTSRLPAPPKWIRNTDQAAASRTGAAYERWWRTNRNRVELWDPWLLDLVHQRID